MAISRLKQEFTEAVKRRSDLPFRPTADVNAGIAALTKALETKRQTSTLSPQENEWLAAIDKLQEEIIKFNQQPGGSSQIQKSRDMVYNLGKSVVSEEVRDKLPPIIPKISDEQASKIMADFGQQFEEKVLKKLKKPFALDGSALGPDFATAASFPGGGRNLEDYLALLRPERPNQPFQDKDSQMDLSKIQHKIAE